MRGSCERAVALAACETPNRLHHKITHPRNHPQSNSLLSLTLNAGLLQTGCLTHLAQTDIAPRALTYYALNYEI